LIKWKDEKDIFDDIHKAIAFSNCGGHHEATCETSFILPKDKQKK
jgi:hypothetical protein